MTERVDRRTILGRALRTTAAASLTLGGLADLAGCATYIRPAPGIPGYKIDVAPLPPGVQGLIAERAAQVGIAAQTNQGTASSSQRGAIFGGLTERQGGGNFDPVYDRSPRGTDLVVVQADADAAPLARTVMRQGVRVISYLAPLRYQTAQITLPPGALGARLAADALAWARARPHLPASAVFVSGVPAYGSPAWISQHGPPPPGPPPPVVLTPDEHAIRAAFAGADPPVRLATIDFLEDPTRALRADPRQRIVLCANDLLALDLAQTLRARVDRAARRDLYVGGVGTPSIGQSGTLSGQGSGVEPWMRELRRGDVLRALAVVRLRDLAYSLVDLPAALMRGRRPHDITLSAVLLTRGSAAFAEYERDSRLSP